MQTVTITSTSSSPHVFSDPEDVSRNYNVPPNDSVTFTFGDALFNRLAEEVFPSMRAKTDESGNTLFTIDTSLADTEVDADMVGATADVTRWLGNHIKHGLVPSNPSSASTASAIRVDATAGEAYVDGKWANIAAATDETGDAVVDKDGDAHSLSLSNDHDVYIYFLYVNNEGTVETLFVVGEEADTGDAEELTDDDLAAAVAGYLSETDPNYSFVKSATILLEESSGITQTTTPYRPVPPSYG